MGREEEGRDGGKKRAYKSLLAEAGALFLVFPPVLTKVQTGTCEQQREWAL